MICRVCLKDANCPIEIFDSNGKQLNIAEIIQKHFWFKPFPEDNISTKLCLTCWNRINEFHQFYMIVEAAHENLGRVANVETFIKEEFEAEETVLTEQFNIEIDIKKENVWEDEAKNSLYEPQLQDNVTAGKKMDRNSVESNRKCNSCVIDDSKVDVIDSKELCVVELESVSVTKVRKCKRNCHKKTITKRENISKKKHDAMITTRDDEIIKKHMQMACNLCTFVGETFADMTKHFRTVHGSQRAYVMCCGRKLNQRYQVVQHAYKHEDPEFFKCKECQKVFSDGRVLRTHKLTVHPSESELTYECDQCPKRFALRSFLQLHKASHIPINERKFICEKCPNVKAYASEHLLQKHINMRHNKATNVCHVCAKAIRDNQAFKKHVLSHFEDSGPRVKCPRADCDRWLKDEHNLKQHLTNHNIEGKVYSCNDCGKVCKTHSALTSHFYYAHSSRVFPCDKCNKTFKQAITLKHHMAKHTGESLYNCPFCERTFNANSNLHVHKKKMHPIEFDIWRKTKKNQFNHVLEAVTNNKQKHS